MGLRFVCVRPVSFCPGLFLSTKVQTLALSGIPGQYQAGQQEAEVSLAWLAACAVEGFPAEINWDNSAPQTAVFNINIARFELM